MASWEMSFFPVGLSHHLFPSLCTRPTSKLGGIRAPKPNAGNRLSLGRRKGCGDPSGKASLPVPLPQFLLPVVVLADASHRTQGLQVVVGLAGAQAVQGLAAPRVPVGGGEVNGHLVGMVRGSGFIPENQRRGQARARVCRED